VLCVSVGLAKQNVIQFSRSKLGDLGIYKIKCTRQRRGNCLGLFSVRTTQRHSASHTEALNTYEHACKQRYTSICYYQTHLHVCVCVYLTYNVPHMILLCYVILPQSFLLAFMMGTHSRVGAGSPLQLVDPYIVASIAQSIIDDKWWVKVTLFLVCDTAVAIIISHERWMMKAATWHVTAPRWRLAYYIHIHTPCSVHENVSGITYTHKRRCVPGVAVWNVIHVEGTHERVGIWQGLMACDTAK
jgi:hypothetical protein